MFYVFLFLIRLYLFTQVANVTTEFTWENGGTKVSVSGSFNNWTDVPMTGR